jgi:hypothetical protein
MTIISAEEYALYKDLANNNVKSSIMPKFYLRQKEDKKRSIEEGRPCFKDVEYVQIMIGGDKNNIVDRKIRDEDKYRWPVLYQNFKNGIENSVDGTPVKEWTAISASRALELNALNIFTVEQLADLSDNAIQSIGMDGRSLVSRAKMFLASASDNAASEKIAHENEKLKSEMDALKLQMSELMKQINTGQKVNNEHQ